MRIAALTASCLLLTTATPASADDLASAVDRMVADGYPAVVVYARDGHAEKRVAAGIADRRTGRRATTDDRFRIASNTKAFTATVVLQLVGEGALTLDDPVDRWVPVDPRVTVRDLLRHTSGIYDPASTPEFFAPYEHNRAHVYRPEKVVEMALAHPPTAEPGTQFKYSNTNYLIAGLIIRSLTGEEPSTQIARRVLRPLNLTHTTFPLLDPTIHGPHLRGYDLKGEDFTVFSPSYDWTAGAMISTVDDLAAFHRALFAGDLLPPAQQRDLLTTFDGHGLGVNRVDLPCGSVWMTDGGGPGYTSYAASRPDTDKQVVLASNVFDLAANLAKEPPVPPTDPLAVLNATVC